MNPRMRMAGENPEVARLVLADKYRFLDPDFDFPDDESSVVLEELIHRDAVDQESLQQLLDQTNGTMGVHYTVRDPISGANVKASEFEAQSAYEREVLDRLLQLRARFPHEPVLSLLGKAM